MRFRRHRAPLPVPTPTQVDLAARLERHVRELAGRIGPRHVGRPAALLAAHTYIEQRLTEIGYAIELQQFDVADQTVANIEACKSARTNTFIVIGAHYDTVPGTPGANDNASGVAALLELARMTRGTAGNGRARFVAFVNEEPPWFQTPLMGSLVYAARARNRGDSVLAMLSLETIGYYSDARGSQSYPAPFQLFFPDTGDFLAAVSNLRSRALLRDFTRAFRAASPLPLIGSPAPEHIAGVSWSDHWAFWQQGYPALLLTDTAPFRYPHYHCATDTPEKLDYARLAYAVEGIASWVMKASR